ncbi:hypothetical protein I3843_10G150800 [Carya illinoinensis]|nr:hypothetical protein I3760_10G158900 [Carya illinoinensis]KAG7960903.1 hypothetical protein I3843_10G150800 [Carya illinoinensis]
MNFDNIILVMLVLKHCIFMICFFFFPSYFYLFTDMENNGHDTEHYTSDADNGEEEKENDIDFVIALQLMVASKYYTTYIVKEPCRTSPPIGHKLVIEILNGHLDRCHRQFRMEKYVFHVLCKDLNEIYNLTSTRNITIK